MKPPRAGPLATRTMTVTLPLTHIVRPVQDMGEELPPSDLADVGIRFGLDVRELSASSRSSGPSHPRPTPTLSGLRNAPRVPKTTGIASLLPLKRQSRQRPTSAATGNLGGGF